MKIFILISLVTLITASVTVRYIVSTIVAKMYVASSSPMPPDSSVLQTEEILDPATKSAVDRLHAAFPTHEYQTCYYCYAYENYSFNAAKRRLESVPPMLDKINDSMRTFLGARRASSHVTTNVGVLPAEIWHMVCSHLKHQGLVSLRLTSSGLADIAAEFMIERIRIDTSFESLRRLKGISENRCLSKNVKSLTFEGALLADIGCIHGYMEHFELEHHRADKPEEPPKGKQHERSMRLYNRNLKKWKSDLESKYLQYRNTYEAQQLLLKGPKTHLFECLWNFPKLKNVALRSDVPCHHMLSERFKEKYCRDCAIPLSIDSTQSTWQLESILRPGMKSLSARILSLTFFKFHSQNWLNTMFQELEVLSLTLRPESEILPGTPSTQDTDVHQCGQLIATLSACQNLKSLCVNLCTQGGSDFKMNFDDMFPANHIFTKLTTLDVDCFTSSENKFLQALKKQPKLKSLAVACSRLTQGDWPTVIQRMRRELKLTDLFCYGYLEDSDSFYPMDLCDRDAWIDGQKITLGFSVCCYVTDHDYPDMHESGFTDDEHDLFFNPLRCMDDDYEDDGMLKKLYGPVSDSEDDDDDDDDDGDDESDSDHDTDMDSTSSISSIPPLEDPMDTD